MKDFDAYQGSLKGDTSYSACLNQSLGLVLEQFYENLNTVGVSAVTGNGLDDLFRVDLNKLYVCDILVKLDIYFCLLNL